MMSTNELREALKQRLISGMADRPGTAWPNVTLNTTELPRIEVTFEAVRRQGGTLSGSGLLYETGVMFATVCIKLGTGEEEAFDFADAIMALYPENLIYAFTGGKIEITDPPEPRGGYPDDTCYRVPVSIPYMATDQT